MGKIDDAITKAQRKREKREEPAVFQPDRDPDLFANLPELVVMGRPGSAIAEQFRFLRSQVVWSRDRRTFKTIVITSSLEGEGKTFITANLGVTISQGMDEHVLLVDTDLRNSRLATMFGLSPGLPGLSDHLADNIPLEKLLQRTSIDKLTILPAGSETVNPAELLSSLRMREFIKEVRDRYPDRYVIFDTPPVELAPESPVIANEADGTLLIVLRGKTHRDMASASLERFNEGKLLGVIFNGWQDREKYYKKKKYGYGYGYGYGFGGRKNDE